MQNAFGSGILVGTATVDANGNAIAAGAQTPIQFGVLQEASVDFSFDLKELHGQNAFPITVARGKGKISGKAKYAQLNSLVMANLFFGQSITAGLLQAVVDQVGVAIPGTPFTITPTVPGSGTWSVDQGVLDASGVPMTRVVSGPTAGQYSVAAGVYTFAAADTGKIVRISYQYTATSTVARRSTITNLLMGSSPKFRADLIMPYEGKQLVLTLPNCISSKLALGTKLDDFVVPEFDFSGFSDPSGVVGFISVTE
jgi:hypothetical protein